MVALHEHAQREMTAAFCGRLLPDDVEVAQLPAADVERAPPHDALCAIRMIAHPAEVDGAVVGESRSRDDVVQAALPGMTDIGSTFDVDDPAGGLIAELQSAAAFGDEKMLPAGQESHRPSLIEGPVFGDRKAFVELAGFPRIGRPTGRPRGIGALDGPVPAGTTGA